MYTINEIKEIVEKALVEFECHNDPKELYAPMSYMMAIGGKRLRPVTALMVCSMFKNNIENEDIKPAIALEVFHAFTLIHDDIMDKAAIRRGQPTVYKKWNSNVAILSGDVMSIKAYSLISQCRGEYLPQILKLFSETAAQVCEGQQYDMNFEDLPFITMEDYIAMIGLKTAVLIAASAAIGAIMGGASEKDVNLIYKFAYLLGIAFQIQDDYFDTFGDEHVFGKAIGGDILNDKKTWLLVDAFRMVTPVRQPQFQGLLAMDSSRASEKIEGFKALYTDLGVKDRAQEAINAYYRQALELLNGSNLTEVQKDTLREWADMVVKRIK